MTSDKQINPPNEEEISVKRKKRRRRLYPLLAVLGIAIGFCATCFAVALYRPVGSGPAGPKVEREPFASVWSEEPVLLLGIGDSVTAGFGVPAAYGYVNRLADNPPDEFPEMQGVCLRKVWPKLEVKNIAVSGSTSLQHESYLNDDERFPKQPENVFGIVVMTTGGNDIIHNYGQSPPKEGAMYGASIEQATPWIENFRGRLDRMIDRITEKFPGGCMIFLADIYDPTDGVGDAPSAFLPAWPDCMKVLDAYNAVIAEAATKHPNVVLVPMHDAFLGHGIHCSQFWRKHYKAGDPTYWFYTNLEDPNIRGYDAIRRLFLNEILLKKKDAVPK
ncbi:MAG: SGNH/GDSL hydrolase family protein [Planctomycetaceae bacterium]|nr:SGNH/GDSL hydrolase family protein [Planctomycetaceae bacterium]